MAETATECQSILEPFPSNRPCHLVAVLQSYSVSPAEAIFPLCTKLQAHWTGRSMAKRLINVALPARNHVVCLPFKSTFSNDFSPSIPRCNYGRPPPFDDNVTAVYFTNLFVERLARARAGFNGGGQTGQLPTQLRGLHKKTVKNYYLRKHKYTF